MIDEKKLIEEISKCVISRITPDGSSPYDRDIQFYNEAIVDVLGIVEEQPKIGEWIPVEEALPKELQRVLVQKITGTIEVLRYYGEKNKWGGDSYHNVHPRLIKAWQPLPKPYEVEDETN